jgi:hypothetical protein
MSAISDGPIDIPQQLQPKSHDVMVISHGMAFRHLSTGFGNEASKGDREVSERTYPQGIRFAHGPRMDHLLSHVDPITHAESHIGLHL